MPLTEAELIGFAVSYALVLAATVLFYRFSNKTIIKKILELRRKEDDLRKQLEHLYKVRQGEAKDLRKRIESLEEKVDVLSKSEGEEKELAREKVLARTARK